MLFRSLSEAATGGLLAHRLTGVAGSESCFRGAVVEPHRVAASGSAQTASRAAEECRLRTQADWGLAIGDCSRLEDRETDATAPVVHIALAGREGTRAIELNVAGDPAIVKSRVAKSALNLLRLKLLRQPK